MTHVEGERGEKMMKSAEITMEHRTGGRSVVHRTGGRPVGHRTGGSLTGGGVMANLVTFPPRFPGKLLEWRLYRETGDTFSLN